MQAQYAAVDEVQVGLMPTTLNHTEAGTIPLVGLTSLEMLQKTGAPWPKQNLTVVVTSGTGGTVRHTAVFPSPPAACTPCPLHTRAQAHRGGTTTTLREHPTARRPRPPARPPARCAVILARGAAALGF